MYHSDYRLHGYVMPWNIVLCIMGRCGGRWTYLYLHIDEIQMSCRVNCSIIMMVYQNNTICNNRLGLPVSYSTGFNSDWWGNQLPPTTTTSAYDKRVQCCIQYWLDSIYTHITPFIIYSLTGWLIHNQPMKHWVD